MSYPYTGGPGVYTQGDELEKERRLKEEDRKKFSDVVRRVLRGNVTQEELKEYSINIKNTSGDYIFPGPRTSAFVVSDDVFKKYEEHGVVR